jgi:hypothetical protein
LSFGAYLGERRRARLVVTVNQQNVTPALRQRHGDVDGQCGLADAALDISNR